MNAPLNPGYRRAPFLALPLDAEPFLVPAQLAPQERVVWLKAHRLSAEKLPLRITPGATPMFNPFAWALKAAAAIRSAPR